MAQDMNSKFRRPVRDLTHVRAQLTTIRNDLQSVAGLGQTTAALTKALEELALVEHINRPLPFMVRAWTLPTRGH
jgi:hypothetical protein